MMLSLNVGLVFRGYWVLDMSLYITVFIVESSGVGTRRESMATVECV